MFAQSHFTFDDNFEKQDKKGPFKATIPNDLLPLH